MNVVPSASLILALCLVACSPGRETAESSSSTGSESDELSEATVEATSVEAASADEASVREVGAEPDDDSAEVGMLLGVLPGGVAGLNDTPEQRAERARASAARRAARDAERAQRQAACGAPEARLSITAGRPTPPPTRGGTAAFDQARRLYEAREPAPTPTGTTAADTGAWARERFAPWMQQRTTRMRELEALAPQLPPEEKAILAAWSGHLYLDIAEMLLQTPAPAELQRDAEQLAVYRELLREHAIPLLEQAGQRFQWCVTSATPAWRAHCEAAERWSTHASCTSSP